MSLFSGSLQYLSITVLERNGLNARWKMKNDSLLVGGSPILESRFVDIVSVASTSSDYTIFIDTEKRKPGTWRTGYGFGTSRAHVEGRA